MIKELSVFIIFNFLINSLLSQIDYNSIHIEKNENYQEQVVIHKDLAFNVPYGWRMYSVQETEELKLLLNQNLEYTVDFDYYLKLKSNDEYPVISVQIQKVKGLGDLSFRDFKNRYLEINKHVAKRVLESTKSHITNYKSGDLIVDDEKKRIYLISDVLVVNVGSVRSNSLVIHKDDYLITLTFAHKLKEYDKYESALIILANSFRFQ